MSIVFFKGTAGRGLINSAHVILINTETHKAALTDGTECGLEFVKNRDVPETVEFGHPYNYEDEFGWLSSGLSQIAEAIGGQH